MQVTFTASYGTWQSKIESHPFSTFFDSVEALLFENHQKTSSPQFLDYVSPKFKVFVSGTDIPISTKLALHFWQNVAHEALYQLESLTLTTKGFAVNALDMRRFTNLTHLSIYGNPWDNTRSIPLAVTQMPCLKTVRKATKFILIFSLRCSTQIHMIDFVLWAHCHCQN